MLTDEMGKEEFVNLLAQILRELGENDRDIKFHIEKTKSDIAQFRAVDIYEL
jgi:hypothetical protein